MCVTCHHQRILACFLTHVQGMGGLVFVFHFIFYFFFYKISHEPRVQVINCLHRCIFNIEIFKIRPHVDKLWQTFSRLEIQICAPKWTNMCLQTLLTYAPNWTNIYSGAHLYFHTELTCASAGKAHLWSPHEAQMCFPSELTCAPLGWGTHALPQGKSTHVLTR